ncbi:hypothetical protein K239x_58330 [Planctomycetes bacterium K23_9]|uniref:Uncharacterized protein n=1 Tax=Stieleria marina TaxID=1930275 RepID=A0A517P379_9BACT|nr:hypothetical protein K239x_58330 [Planctomycetes bacterium K23_9]
MGYKVLDAGYRLAQHEKSKNSPATPFAGYFLLCKEQSAYP